MRLVYFRGIVPSAYIFWKLLYVQYFCKKSNLFSIPSTISCCACLIMKPFHCFFFQAQDICLWILRLHLCAVNKDACKVWNNRFITLFLFCVVLLAMELSEALSSICSRESSSKLLFQQFKDQLIKLLHICLTMPFICVMHTFYSHLCCRLWRTWGFCGSLKNPKCWSQWTDSIQGLRRNKLRFLCHYF